MYIQTKIFETNPLCEFIGSPSAPTNLSVADITSKSVTLQWGPPLSSGGTELTGKARFLTVTCIFPFLKDLHSSNRPHEKESTKVRITQKMVKEKENSYKKMKRSPEKRHTQTHRNLIEIFRRSHTFTLF